MSATLQLPASRPSLQQPQQRGWAVPFEAAAFVVAWLVLMLAGRERLFQDPGTFWHTAVGQRILDTGALVREDPFTFTFGGRPWIAHQWLGECMMAAGYRIGGWDSLLVATATLLALLFAWFGQRMVWAGVSPVTTAIILLLVFGASAHHFHVRPHLASIVLMPVCYALLRDVECGRARLTRLLWLPPLVAVWANMHGGVLGGLATVMLVLLGWSASAWFGKPSPLARRGDFVLAWGVGAACLAAVFFNPYGVETPRAWLTIMRLSLPDVIQEHGRLQWTRPEAWFVAALMAVYAHRVWQTRRWSVTTLLVFLWFVLACDRVRHAPLFATIVAVSYGNLLPGPIAQPKRNTAWLLAAAILLVCWPLQAAALRFPVVGAGWARLDQTVWPTDLLPALRQLERQRPRAVFNSLHYGGLLAFYTPALQTFIDDRCELFGDEFLRAYAQAERNHPQRLDDWQRQYGFRYALVRAGSPFDQYLQMHPHWRRLQHSSAANLYALTAACAPPQ